MSDIFGGLSAIYLCAGRRDYRVRYVGRAPSAGLFLHALIRLVLRAQVRAVPATSPAAGAPGGQETGGQHEQARPRIEIASLAAVKGGVVRGEDLRPMWMVCGQPERMRTPERSGG
jgi:hypothetical protein